ncbi:hypothetical protein DC74_6131 [Streptomyces noursei]|nr:hypothetical protein DC74_6131 [Streptomyces noursei]
MNPRTIRHSGHRIRVPCAESVPSLDFTAFRQLHQRVYLRYALARTGSEACARRTINQTFADLSQQWQCALESPCPASVAWQLLSDAAGIHDDCLGDHGWCRFYQLLDVQHADVVVLYRHLELDVEKIATLMGANPFSVHVQLGAADTALANRPVSLSRPVSLLRALCCITE